MNRVGEKNQGLFGEVLATSWVPLPLPVLVLVPVLAIPWAQ